MSLCEEDRRNLFKPFFKSASKENRDRNTHSNGLGLSICKRLAESLDGDLYLADSYNQGCQFVLSLNLEQVEYGSRQANYSFRGNNFGKKKPRLARRKRRNYQRGITQIQEVPEELILSNEGIRNGSETPSQELLQGQTQGQGQGSMTFDQPATP